MKNLNQQACEQLRGILDNSVQGAIAIMKSENYNAHTLDQTIQSCNEAIEGAVSFITLLEIPTLSKSELVYIGQAHYLQKVQNLLKAKLGGTKPC